MLKELVQHIQKTTQPLILDVGGSKFSITGDGRATEIRPAIDHPETLTLHSLDALVKLVRTEAAKAAKPIYITVPDHLTVRCFGQPESGARFFRQVYYEVRATGRTP